jgi:uroporphyrinogen-III synthase
MPGPLAGKTVALLRASGQGGELQQGFEALGARVLLVPMIAFAPPEDPEPLRRAASEAWDWIVLTSPNAVAALLGAQAGPPRARIASLGPGTTARLREAGLEPALEAGDSIQEGLAAALVARGVRGQRVLLPRADLARDALLRALREAGALVTDVIAYRTVEGEGDPALLLAAIDAGELDAICFTSSSTARHLGRRITELGPHLSRGRPLVASMGPATSATLRELGLAPGVEATEHTARGLVAAVRAALENETGP